MQVHQIRVHLQIIPIKITIYAFLKMCIFLQFLGWQYIATEEGRWRKGLWIIVVIIAEISASYLLFRNLNEYITARPRTFLESTTAPLDEVTFPVMTICNINQLR